MKQSVIARGIVEMQEAEEIAAPESGAPDADQVLVQMRIRRYFVYDGEPGARFEHGRFLGLDEPEKHAFVQHANGMLTPFGSVEMSTNLARLGWSYRELAGHCGVSAGACRDAILRTSCATNTYPRMLAAVRLGLHALEAAEKKAKAAA